MTSKEEIEHAMKMADMAKYPFIAYVNPNEPQEVRDKVMEIGCVKKVVEDARVESGKVIFMQRTELEFIDPPEPLKPIYESATTCNERCGDMVERTVEEQIKNEMELIKKKLNIEEK